ncbi:MAG TPA: HAD family hydrolase, partial [Proteobacteria bacterium]|nr:HAD family hydrolase [Pseudomonadota bacterium]
AGKAAGTRTIGVLTGFDNHEMLEKENPDAIINSLANLPEVILM